MHAMKKYVSIVLFFVFLVPVGLSGQSSRTMTGSMHALTGVDLLKEKTRLAKKINRGDDTLIPVYADVLFHLNEMDAAYHMYHNAIKKEISLDTFQHRNASFAARRIGKTWPSHTDTGYFTSYHEKNARIKPFCHNSANEDFAPFVWHDMVFITSSRPESPKKQRNLYRFTQLPFLNVFAFTHDCEPLSLNFLPSSLNSRLHDGPMSISTDTTLLITTKTHIRPNRNGVQTLFLAYYTMSDGQWSEMKQFPFNSPAFFVQHPWYDDRTNTLYFSSDMPGGEGGFDLYKTVWDGQSWGPVINLGPEVNSIYDEVFPAVSPGGELLFSTNHHETSGGLDIVIMKDDERQLLPPPINSPYDDFSVGFINEFSGYFASNRDTDVFGDNLYSFELFAPVEHPFMVLVVDKETQMPLPGARVSYYAIDPQLDQKDMTSNEGEVLLYTGEEEPFKIALDISKEGYYHRDLVSDAFVFEGNRWLLTVEMVAVPDEPAIQEAISSGYFVIYFDNHHPEPNSWKATTKLSYNNTFTSYKNNWPAYFEQSASQADDLQYFFDEAEKGMQQLNWLASFIEQEFMQGRSYVIIFTSHASPLGTDPYNMLLSKRRFASVENFLTTWEGGRLKQYIDAGMLDYENIPFGSLQAAAGVSSDPRDLSRSIYSVEAARERKVTISWRRDTGRDGGSTARDILTYQQTLRQRHLPGHGDETSPVFYIIAGSFSQLETAERFAAELRGQGNPNSFVLPRTPDGYYRVSYNTLGTREAADAALARIRQTLNPGAWILER